MKPKTIRTDTRIFEVTNYEGETYLCNLKHFKLSTKQGLLGYNKEPLVQVRHYWNNTFKVIGKIHVKEMILANG
jgi:hypothetical protein